MKAMQLTRAKLIQMVRNIQNAQDRGVDYSDLQAKFAANVPYPRAIEMLRGDYSAEHIVDFSLGWKANDDAKLSKAELVELIKKILEARGTSAEQALLLTAFKRNCVHPAKSNLIYYPQKYFNGRVDPSAEEIAEKALEVR